MKTETKSKTALNAHRNTAQDILERGNKGATKIIKIIHSDDRISENEKYPGGPVNKDAFIVAEINHEEGDRLKLIKSNVKIIERVLRESNTKADVHLVRNYLDLRKIINYYKGTVVVFSNFPPNAHIPVSDRY